MRHRRPTNFAKAVFSRADADYSKSIDFVEFTEFFTILLHAIFSSIDLHDENGVKPQKLPHGKVPTIPRGALIPKGSKNIMVAGRCLSSDRLANSAARVQASSMGMGQAAAVTAVLAAQGKTTPSEVPLEKILSLIHI